MNDDPDVCAQFNTMNSNPKNVQISLAEMHWDRQYYPPESVHPNC